MKLRAPFIAAAAFAVALAAAPAAQAFTIEDQGGSASGGSGFKDLDIPKVQNGPADSRFNSGGPTTIKQGNTTFQFGSQRSFEQRYNTDNLFDPYAREGR